MLCPGSGYWIFCDYFQEVTEIYWEKKFAQRPGCITQDW